LTLPEQLRILMIHNRYLIRGGEDASTDVSIDLLRAAGHKVLLLEDSNERVDDLGLMRTAARAVWSRESHAKVREILSSDRFDVVHVQNSFPLFSPSVNYAASRHGVPVVQSLRNFRLLCPEGMLHRDGAVCTDCVGKRFAWPGVVHKCYRNSATGSAVVATVSGGHRLIGTWKNRIARYVAPSSYAKDIYVRNGWAAHQISVIPNFVYPDPGSGDGSGGFALYAGRLAAVKGLDTLLEVWSDESVPFPLKIAGEGPLLGQVAAATQSNPQIEYVGALSATDITEMMGNAAFIVVPTRGIESFGRVVAEALATGTPAIVADHGGLRETVAGHGVGLLFPPGDSAALRAQVHWLADHRDDLAAMRGVARASFLERFSGERILSSWADLYRELSSARAREGS
jgi:glycosyltransferase involved in cell wall biosynthesis